jgi:hypothetical protein
MGKRGIIIGVVVLVILFVGIGLVGSAKSDDCFKCKEYKHWADQNIPNSITVGYITFVDGKGVLSLDPLTNKITVISKPNGELN